MGQASYDRKRLRKATLATTIIFVLMLFGTVLQWGVASGWGSITIRRVSYITEGGKSASGMMFIPNGVNDENPRPAVINLHGRNNSSFNMINLAIEQARRGYIVFNPDLAGTVESDHDEANIDTRIFESAFEYLQSLDMVTEISTLGHSRGVRYIRNMILAEDDGTKPKLVNLIEMGGMFQFAKEEIPFASHTNFLCVDGGADLYDKQLFGDYDTLHNMVAKKSGHTDDFEIGKLYGDPANGTAFQYVEIPGMTHQGLLYSKIAIGSVIEFIERSCPTETPLSASSMIFPLYQVISACCFVLFLLMIASLAYLFTSLPGIYSVVNTPLPVSQGKPARKWAMHILTDFAIPIALFVPVTRFVAAKVPITFFVSKWINQILMWLAVCAIISTIFIIVRSVRKKKESGLTPVDFGLGTEKEKMFVWKRIGCAVAIAIAVAVLLFAWMDVVFKTTGLNYQFNSMPGQIMRGSPERVIYTLRYMIFMLPVYFVININIATTRRMKTTGNECHDTVRDVLVNILLSAGSLTLLMVIQFGGIRILGTGAVPLNNTLWDSLAYGWSFPLMMSTCSGVSTYLYRKTGNIWTGTITTCLMVIAITVFQCSTMP